MSTISAVQRLQSYRRFAHQPSLAPMQRLLQRLGDPQLHLRYVHVVGTNGKGSLTAMMAAILQAAGYRVGMSISPYVTDFRERFQIDGRMIEPDVLEQLAQLVCGQAEAMAAAGEGEIGQFEAVSALALLWFCRQQCDIVCLEAGLGGRWDATNVIPPPLLTLIGRIGLDHTAVLGDTVEAIAREKCAVIKPGTVVISYPQQPRGAAKVVQETCAAQQVPILIPDMQDIHLLASHLLQNRVEYGGYEQELPMKGTWQGMHMAMAIEGALALWRAGWQITDEAILQGLAAAALPARMELLSLQPIILLDGSHNPDGIDALAGMIERSGLPRMHAVVGMMRDKACGEMLQRLSDCFDKVYTVAVDDPRAVPSQQLAEMARSCFDEVIPMTDIAAALRQAQQGIGGRKGLCICGSLYLAGQARKILLADTDR